jgi:hypothetical protein
MWINARRARQDFSDMRRMLAVVLREATGAHETVISDGRALMLSPSPRYLHR